MNGERVLIDTSVWIAFFRKGDGRLGEKVDEVLNLCDVFVPRVVMAELIQGARSEKEIAVIEDFLEAFHVIDQREDTWLKAGRLSYTMKRRGLCPGLIDCYVAVLASDNGCAVFSLDEHFGHIVDFLKIDLFRSDRVDSGRRKRRR